MKQMPAKLTAFILLYLAACLVLAGCGAGSSGSAATPKTVAVSEVCLTNNDNAITLSGNIIPAETVKLSFKVAGVISAISVAEGDMVYAGQPLAALNDSDYALQEQAALAQWQSARMQIGSELPARVNQAKAQLDLTQATCERARELYQQGAASLSQLEEAEAKLIVDQNTYQLALEAQGIAQTELGMAKSAYELASSQVADTVIFSPIDGVVLQKIAEAGEITAAGYPLLAVGSIRQVRAEAGVPDSVVNQLALGQQADIYVYGAEQACRGEIVEIGFLADSNTRMFPVRLLIDNETLTLKPGMIARINLIIASREQLCVPFSSIVQLAGGPAVYLYDPDSCTVRQVSVTTGELSGEQIEVLAGLQPGDLLVTEGQFKLKDGETVLLKGGAALD